MLAYPKPAITGLPSYDPQPITGWDPEYKNPAIPPPQPTRGQKIFCKVLGLVVLLGTIAIVASLVYNLLKDHNGGTVDSDDSIF